MTGRRARGDGSIYWDGSKKRWVAALDVGFYANGKRRRTKRYTTTETAARKLLRELQRAHADGLPPEQRNYTVAEAVEAWLAYGLVRRDESTIVNRRNLAHTHILPALGRRRLHELTADEIDRWLATKAETLATDTVERLLSILRNSIRRAQARDLVRRNVALLCDPPRGTVGRPSKSLTLDQARAVLRAAEGDSLHAYVVTSLLTGARTEELRALTWSHLHLDDDPPRVEVWRSVRRDGETKTERSRRTLELPERCIAALRAHGMVQAAARLTAGDRWVDDDLVFCTQWGTALDSANVRRSFRRIVKAAGLNPREWAPRELRHSFVSLLSSSGMAIEDISHLVGHISTRVTELIYRKELRPMLTKGAAAMDTIFTDSDDS